jgi:hypothetical protein
MVVEACDTSRQSRSKKTEGEEPGNKITLFEGVPPATHFLQ